MRRLCPAILKRLLVEREGQSLPWIALMMVVFLGMAGIVIDVGHAFLAFRGLQEATDSAALAGAAALPNTTATTQATSYSAVSGNLNAANFLGTVAMASGYPKLLCLNALKTVGMPCVTPANANAVQVKETATISTFFLPIVGIKSITVSATATASMRGATAPPYNVAIILDATASMNTNDNSCGTTRFHCALNGIQVLLNELYPCSQSYSTCSVSNGVATNSVDRVSIFNFPAVTQTSTSHAYDCSGTAMTGQPYTFPSASATTYNIASTVATYQIMPLPGASGTAAYFSDYRTSDTATTLSSSSNLVKTVGGASGCTAMPAHGGEGTYYAGAIYAAIASLKAQRDANTGSQNVIILLSDGDASSATLGSGATNNVDNYPSTIDFCGQGIKAAQYAISSGYVDRFYTVAYGSPTSGGCSTDSSGTYKSVQPCTAMQDMASSPAYFFSDNISGSTCYSSAQPTSNMNQIFSIIGGTMTLPRLIPDGTT